MVLIPVEPGIHWKDFDDIALGRAVRLHGSIAKTAIGDVLATCDLDLDFHITVAPGPARPPNRALPTGGNGGFCDPITPCRWRKYPRDIEPLPAIYEKGQ